MAQSGQVIENPVTGQSILFITTAAESGNCGWEYEWTIQPFCGANFPAPHQHTYGAERFEILAGVAKYQIDGVEKTARAGEVIDIPLRTMHIHPWSANHEILRMRHIVTVNPPTEQTANTEIFFETLFSLARAGRVNKAGAPNLLHLAVIARPAMPLSLLLPLPDAVQLSLFGFLAGLGKALGYKPRA
jgi:mannose-6-phosphate isomerase-like protein (cupin superfamily)